MSNYIKINKDFYILASSSLADDRTMVLKDGDAFGVFDRYGDIHPIGQGAQGLFCEGTRFISRMEMLIEGQRPLILSSGLNEENEQLTADLTNPDYTYNGKMVEKGTLHIHRSKFLWKNVCYESVRLCNFGLEPLTFTMSFEFNSDFKDIFQVRGISRDKNGKRFKPLLTHDEILLSYKGLDNIRRKSRIKLGGNPTKVEEKRAEYDICLLPKACEFIEISMAFEIGYSIPQPSTYDQALKELYNGLNKIKESASDIITSHEQFNKWLTRSRSDMATMITKTEHGYYPYAGVPWYSTPFGRDGILTAYECLWNNPDLTKDTLTYLSKTQAKEWNEFQDAEPGKIFHEKRGGEMAELGEIPFKMYYGTIDATPLFVCLAGAYYERTGDLETIKNIWPNILLALEWIDNYGDVDGDGFVEYAKKSEKGLVNQGWKDSHDSIFHEDGKMAVGPIALCEVQGYVYEAKVRGAELADELNYSDLSAKLYRQAEELKEKFAQSFWIPEKNTFAIALDGKKSQCKVSTSNAGHCLFSGIVKQEHAEKLANTLLGESLFSGWGIRTAAVGETRYNPMSYHNGSIWPHDNAIIAYGLGRYGFPEEANKVMGGLFNVTNFVEAQRLPELFCGFDMRKNEGPTAYPVACSPQAWAVASIYMLLQASLGIRIVAKENAIYFYKPTLPSFLNEITITNLKVNNSKVLIQIRKSESGTTVNVLHREGDVKVEIVNSNIQKDILNEAALKA